MVLLSMTPGIVRALQSVIDVHRDDIVELQEPHEPALSHPQVGSPISHRQLIGLSKLLKKHVSTYSNSSDPDSHAPIPITLAALLLNTTVFIPPPPPKPTKSAEYEALMARLRAEEEARRYGRMLHPPPTRETFNQRFPKAAQAFSLGANVPSDEDEDLSYEEVHRQIILIINILISIVCVAVFIWVAARHWSVGKRLGLSMGGALAIAVAEVAVYGGYVRKVREAKKKEKKKPEIKEIVKSWALENGKETEAVVGGGREKEGDGMRFRKGKHR